MAIKNPFKYYLLYKPFGVICQFSPEGNHTTLKDIIDVEEDVYSVGRLDTDSEGLLLLTNDKSVNKRLLAPSMAKNKTYYVQVEGDITIDAIEKLKKGDLSLSHKGKKYQTRPAIAHLISDPKLPERTPPIRFRKNIPTSWLSLTIYEGKNRQVRKMTAAVGFPTLRLVRYSIQKANIDNMKVGQITEISQSMFKELFY